MTIVRRARVSLSFLYAQYSVVSHKSPTSAKAAVSAQNDLVRQFTVEGILGPAGPGPDGAHHQRQMGISATPPPESDHFIEIIVPKWIAVSHIPSEVNGVRIVVIHEDHPGWFAPAGKS